MPAYNAASTIRESIASVLAQTYPNLELVVVDDGSTDETAEIVKALGNADRRIQYLFQKNQGAVTARNTGVAAATSELIAIIDADDLWHPAKIARQLATMSDSRDVVVLTGLQRFHLVDGQKVWGRVSIPPPPTDERYPLFELLLLDGFQMVLMNTALMPRATVLKVGGFRHWTAHDWYMWIEASKHCRFRVIEEPLFFYRKHAASVTARQQALKVLDEHEKIIRDQASRANLSWIAEARALTAKRMDVCGHMIMGSESMTLGTF